jgi:hypothetical protein
MTIAQPLRMEPKARPHIAIVSRVLKACLFTALFIFIFSYVTDKLIPDDAHWYIARESIQGMYDLPANSIDLAILGGSSMYHSFSPYELYKEYGVSAYSFGTSGQPMVASYAILKDLLRSQSPRMVIVEAEKLTSSPNEPFLRRVFDMMPLSAAKARSILEHTRIDGADSLLSYVFPLVRYHTTWKDIPSTSFIIDPLRYETMYRGFVMNSGKYGQESAPIDDPGEEMAEYNEEGLAFLTRIANLCKERDIPLVLYASIYVGWNGARHNSTQAFADDHDLEFIDFNTRETMEAIDFSYADDLRDTSHTNTFGAIKVTRFLGEAVIKTIAFPDRRGEASYAYLAEELADYEHWVHVERLQAEKNMSSYLAAITDARSGDYTAFFSVKDEATNGMSGELKEAFMDAGITIDFSDKYRFSILGVIEGGKVVYEWIGSDRTEALKYTGTAIDGTPYFIESAGMEAGNRSTIQIDGGANLSMGSRGFNIVIYDNRTHRAVDSAAWDTHAPDTIDQGKHKAMTP